MAARADALAKGVPLDFRFDIGVLTAFRSLAGSGATLDARACINRGAARSTRWPKPAESASGTDLISDPARPADHLAAAGGSEARAGGLGELRSECERFLGVHFAERIELESGGAAAHEQPDGFLEDRLVPDSRNRLDVA